MVQHPEVLWAQRSSDSDAEKNILYVTINLPDIVESSLDYNLTPTNISFKAKAGAPGVHVKEYAFDLEFFGDVVPEKSKKFLSSRSLSLIIIKKERQSEYWPRLTKEKIKNAFLKTDFSKWVDEDEQNGETVVQEEPDMGMGGMGGGMGGGMDFEKMMAQMGQGGMGDMDMGGLGGLGGSGSPGENPFTTTDEADESDDDGPPPLEDAEAK